ncbi:MAG: nitrite/sulfite reductase [Nitrososphaeraceae archaeon]|nr:nitrite/sulfite reductase [Nitrososphaeraceae archaeon]MDW3611049.1 nitrite/sulfite reductase [Nitrososphaeraceae archaeon]MDW3625059.1 nitrite/sulfite reductase [Nitrososphaeraceae archaeon]
MKKNEELTKVNHEKGSFVKPRETWGLEKETDNFANKVKLYRQGKLSDDDFRRFRLQHGAYGSRLRPDYSMIRIKIPSGEITPDQLEKIANLSEAFSIGSAHVSTRQNIQLHWVQLEDVSEVMRGLVEVGLTTREACGNTVRNVMCSHFAGVCPDEVFDATPYSTAIAKFLLRNPMSQNLPRKFKINFGCCNKHGLVRIADIGLVPDLKDGKKGFRIYLGGGLGAASFIGHLLEDFTFEEQLLSTCMATIRLFDRLGNRDNMARNRMRYLVNEIGWEKFQKMVLKERNIVEMTISEFTKNLYQVHFNDSYVPINKSTKFNKLPIVETNISTISNGYDRWLHTNVVPQKQEGYFTIFITLGAGDITANQLRSLASLIRKFSSESIARNTPQQNFAIRYIYANDLPDVYKKLMAIGLANPGALTITSAVGCSGTTSCNLAITNSHRLAKEVQRTLLELGFDVDNDLRNSTIKISGCPNSCGQHEIATIGFFGGAARIENSMAPVYTMLFGGNGYEDGKLGKAIMRVPAKRVIEVIQKIVELYKTEKSSSETLDMWIDRIINSNGSGNIKNIDDIKTLLTPVTQLPPFEEGQEFYQDYGNDIKFVAKTARGECAA